MHGVNSNCALVVHPRAQILDQFAFLSDYSTKVLIVPPPPLLLASSVVIYFMLYSFWYQKDILVIQSAPQLIRVGISQSKTMQQMKGILLSVSYEP